MPRLSKKEKQELEYLNAKNSIREFSDTVGYHNILRYMIDQLDIIDDVSNTQSIELFKLISSLETALQSYERLKSDLQTV